MSINNICTYYLRPLEDVVISLIIGEVGEHEAHISSCKTKYT